MPEAAPARGAARGARRAGAAALALLPLLATACGGPDQWLEKYPQTSFAPASDFAHAIDKLQWLAIWLSVIVGVLVFIALIVIMAKFREREGGPAPKWVHGNTRLELAWTLIPAVLLAIVAVPTVQTIFSTQGEPPADALTVDAVGWQWWWEFRY
ncbi:MAG TPA: cytochrome c oxidase subunit II transmembrane domain-containing protein, partial [Longimicrobiaceae bacterium]|nr:cytochrome c oxidase subunit II transmembrane domain-containing protein [Longimicrobiaceae bacterium]